MLDLSSRGNGRRALLSRRRVLASLAGFGAVAASAAVVAAPAAQAGTVDGYVVQTPSLAQVTSTLSNPAPWNEWQGDPANTLSDVFTPAQVSPTYEAGSAYTGSNFPDVSSFEGTTADGAVDGSGNVVPYPSGVVGTPGPLPGYCGSGSWSAEAGLSGTSVNRQPAGTLPLGPDYFPHIVVNSDGSLTGYFDYRPKDADEAIIAATSTDGGKTWTYDDEALEQDPGYCPTADNNDDGQGHPNVVTVSGAGATSTGTGSDTNLYTLERAAGDNVGVGLLVHSLAAATTTGADPQPLGGLPASQPAGVDPDSFVPAGTATVTVAPGSSVAINVDATGIQNSPEQLVTGGFVDLTQTPVPNASDVISCTVTLGATQLTGCSTPKSTGATVNVTAGDLIEQVIGYVGGSKSSEGTAKAKYSVTAGPNTPKGSGGVSSIYVFQTDASAANPGFTNLLTGALYNAGAPGKLYIDGTGVYCNQANDNFTTKIENCTTGPDGATLSVNDGDPITADPIIPAGTQMTTGLVAPDGIVGVLPSYGTENAAARTAIADNQIPSNATFVMYTEKELNYYLVGQASKNDVTDGGSTSGVSTNTVFGANNGTATSTPFQVTFDAGDYMSQDIANFINEVNSDDASASVTVYIGDDAGDTGGDGYVPSSDTSGDTVGNAANEGAYVPVTCTGIEGAGGGAINTNYGAQDTLTGCTVPAQYAGDGFATSAFIGAPGAALVPLSDLSTQGEGSFDPEKLNKNNEDLETLNVAWTTDGVNFSSAGLPNGGVISGNGTEGYGAYNDLTNPSTNLNPSADGSSSVDPYVDSTDDGLDATTPINLNAYAKSGTPDDTEMRWPGAAGSIILEPNGDYGLFLSGAWSGDADSDAFNQVWYAQSSDGGATWSVPESVVSTDYTFSASANESPDSPLGISAYYSGRAYDPTVVQNPNGTLTMLFAGYRIPGATASIGDVLGTGSTPWTIQDYDAAAYRNILVDQLLLPNPGISFTDESNDTYGDSVSLASEVSDASTGTYTYAVDASSGKDATTGNPVCSISGGELTYTGVGTCVIDVSQAADNTYAATSSALQETITVNPAPLTVTPNPATVTSTYGSAPAFTPSYGGFVLGDSASSASLPDAATCTSPVTNTTAPGTYASSCSEAGATENGNGTYADGDYVVTNVAGSVAVDPAPLTVTPQAVTTTYGRVIRWIRPVYSGFQNDETAAVLKGHVRCFETLKGWAVPGTYTDGSACFGDLADPDYKISYAPGTVTVDQAPTHTELYAWPTTLTTQDPLVLSVYVDGGVSLPTGTVTIYVDGKAVQTDHLWWGSDLVTLSPLAAGTHQVYAVYSGDTDFTGSTSSTVTITVTKPPVSHPGGPGFGFGLGF